MSGESFLFNFGTFSIPSLANHRSTRLDNSASRLRLEMRADGVDDNDSIDGNISLVDGNIDFTADGDKGFGNDTFDEVSNS